VHVKSQSQSSSSKPTFIRVPQEDNSILSNTFNFIKSFYKRILMKKRTIDINDIEMKIPDQQSNLENSDIDNHVHNKVSNIVEPENDLNFNQQEEKEVEEEKQEDKKQKSGKKGKGKKKSKKK